MSDRPKLTLGMTERLTIAEVLHMLEQHAWSLKPGCAEKIYYCVTCGAKHSSEPGIILQHRDDCLYWAMTMVLRIEGTARDARATVDTIEALTKP